MGRPRQPFCVYNRAASSSWLLERVGMLSYPFESILYAQALMGYNMHNIHHTFN